VKLIPMMHLRLSRKRDQCCRQRHCRSPIHQGSHGNTSNQVLRNLLQRSCLAFRGNSRSCELTCPGRDRRNAIGERSSSAAARGQCKGAIGEDTSPHAGLASANQSRFSETGLSFGFRRVRLRMVASPRNPCLSCGNAAAPHQVVRIQHHRRSPSAALLKSGVTQAGNALKEPV
jgi:hypothetical protein